MIRKISYDELKERVLIAAKRMEDDFVPDSISPILRGGMSIAHIFANYFNASLSPFDIDRQCLFFKGTPKKILFVDNLLVDGRSIEVIKDFINNYQSLNNVEYKIYSYIVDPALIDVHTDYWSEKTMDHIIFPWEETNIKHLNMRGRICGV